MKILNFNKDEHGHWVADLECGHSLHVRHDPPWTVRPWVLSPDGRNEFIGRSLRCSACETSEGEAGTQKS